MTLCCAVEMCEAQDDGPAKTIVDGSVAAPPEQPTCSVTAASTSASTSTSTSTASTGKRARGDEYEDRSSAEQGVESDQGGNGSESAIIEKYVGFEKAVAAMGLERAWDMAPLVRVSQLPFCRNRACLACLGNALR